MPADPARGRRRASLDVAPGFGAALEEPFISVIWEANLEFIHHMVEIALLRDLWRTRSRCAG
jgi:hypothetical protein